MDKSPPKPTLVGIGASAGGLDALKQLFSAMPADSGLSFAVVVHLAPDHPSMLADLLQPFTAMPVLQVQSEMEIEPNHVYVIPPGSNLDTIDSHLRLSHIEHQRRERAPVDHFFETLATSHGGHAIAVVLSGTGSDGSYGVKAIKEHGGLTVAQDPDEAQFDGMPQNAIATRLVDLVLRIAEMPKHILRFAYTTPRIDLGGDSDGPENGQQILQQIFAQIRARTGHEFSKYKQSTVLRRIRRRMQLHQIEVLGEYSDYLREHPNEVHLLADEFLITVTQFFRDAETFAYLERQIIPKLFHGKNAADRIRIWSVGCATGEEAYSLAILLLEQKRKVREPPEIEIFASDLHERSLERARAGVYPETIEAAVSPKRLQTYFRKEDGAYRVGKDVRELVVFASHNLLRDPPFSRLDLIVCRNVLIYLQRDAQGGVVDLFHYALNPDGLLILGPSETIERSALFQPESKEHCIFRRRNVPAPEPRLPVFSRLPQYARRQGDPPTRTDASVSYGALHQKMVERYALPSILIDQDSRIVHSSESAARYLQVPGGEMSANVFKLIREELRIELRAALQSATDHAKSTRTRWIAMQLEGKPAQVMLIVRAPRDDGMDGLTLVMFDELDATAASEGERPSPTEDRVELDHTKERLRSVIAQYETSQEEMKVANEELQSINEELRSTMEELETSKEELQSMNEELQTVNQENRHKVEELSQLTSDLNNLIVSTQIATLFLDRQLRILRVTPQAKKLFHVRPSDQGRPLTELRHRLRYDELEQDTRTVLKHLAPIQREIQSETGEWYLTRLLPYRSSADQIQGVVITLVEITQLKHTEVALRDSEETFRALVSASAQIVWTTDAQGLVVDDSPSWRAFTGQTFDQWRGIGWLDAVHPDDRAAAQEAWFRHVKEATPFEAEFRLRHVSGNWRWTYARAVPLRDALGNVRGWVGMNADIDSRKKAETKLRQMDQRKDEFLALLGHELRNPLAPMRTGMELFKQMLPADAKLKRVREMCERQVLHLTRLVDDLLDVSRIKSGRIELQFQRLDLREVVNSAIAEIEPVVEQRAHQLSVEQNAEPLIVDGDETRLTQIITNLLDNAAKYTPEGGHIRVLTYREGTDAVIVLADDGVGIPPDTLTHVFEIFTRGAADPHAPAGGLGLGLTLVERLTTLHGGRVEVSSGGAGKGSKFTVRLPLAKSADQPPPTKQLKPPPGRTTGAAKRILVVDDNQDAADSLAMGLETAGHQVRRAYDGQSALTLAASFAPEVILLNLGLPDMSGHDLAKSLRSQDGDATLIAVSGYGQSEDVDDSKLAGIDHHMVKPVNLESLQEVLDTAPSPPLN